MKENRIRVTKLARYYTLNELTEKTKRIWFVLHGYGEIAKNFIKKFDLLEKDENFFIAPEALNKFYFRGFSGKVGASWMTTEDRENEIEDYINFLEKVYEETVLEKDKEIILFGFSQGTATAGRWFLNSKHSFDKIIMWGGFPPEEFVLSKTKMPVLLVVGERDRFIDKNYLNEKLKTLDDNHITYDLISFNGDHVIDSETLAAVSQKLNSANEGS
ncbi:MAG: dienelactone hydrolase family protein [Melioribacteraceae bacterium]|nr:dienelactone hydrolase family protein [Melioribacteraceae bacterium]MCO6473079.1 dienelactone hydrolase family protein [Melioribacteraceae bacterium]MDD3558014.1 dienelactone hydrolase family protein [Melioribacteraceae bacterium]